MPLLRVAGFRADDLRAGDFLPEDFRADDLRAAEPRRDDFLPDDLRPALPRPDDFFAEEPRPDDFLAELERPPELRERERLLPPDLRPPDFLDVAMKRLRK